MTEACQYLAPGVERGGDDPIFALNAAATSRRAAGESILNATLGALLEDDGQLAVMPSVIEAIRQVDPRRAAAYAPIAGEPAFLQAVIHDLLGDTPAAQQALAVATPGGSGALNLALSMCLAPGEAVLVPNFYWGPYATMAAHTRRRLVCWRLFDEQGGLDLAAFEQAITERLAEQGRALIFFNFPCNNPTGYSPTAAEWCAVAEIVERATHRGPVSLLVDFAYASFRGAAPTGLDELVQRLLGRALVLVAWTASKAFAQYGARIGALVALHDAASERVALQSALSFACRGIWSNCNHGGQLAVAKLLADPTARAQVDLERSRLTALLAERVAAFNQEASGLCYPRYEGGFFVSVFSDAPRVVAERMRADGVFVVPIAGALRIALCSTPARDVARLVASLRRSQAGS
jgi:aromatic-amino-acid transaminase